MHAAFSVFFRSFGAWWREWILLVFFNICWLILVALVIPAPPATAAMYVLARRVVDGELLQARDGWLALRQVLVPSYKWGAINLVIAFVLFVNWNMYQDAPGWLWATLRVVWTMFAIFWLMLNLLYWPFWLVESDQRVINTYRNAAVLVLKAPLFVALLTLLCLLLTVLSIVLTIPFAAALTIWLALIGTGAVDEGLKEARTQ